MILKRSPCRVRPWTALAILALVAACSEPLGVEPCQEPEPRDISHLVTESVAMRLDPQGAFRLNDGDPGVPVTITSAEAARQAEGYVRTFLSSPNSTTAYMERQRGEPIAFDRLEAAPDVFLAVTPFEPVPDSVELYVNKTFASHYLVPLRDGCDRVLSVAVSALNDDIVLDEEGRVRLPRISGGEFRPEGVPVDGSRPLPLAPEAAVEIVAEATGRRVARQPVLLGPERGYVPHWARWLMTLESPVEFTTESGETFRTDTVAVDLNSRLVVPSRSQPRADTMHYPLPFRQGWGRVIVEVRGHYPLRFEVAEVTGR